MRIIAKKALTDYYARHPEAKAALEDWYAKAKEAEWRNFSDIKATFNSVDAVGNQRYIFNIKGNDFRLIVIIQFNHGRIYIRFIGTHAEYDKLKDASKI